MLVKFENVIIVCFLLFISSFHLLIGSDDFEENILKFNLDNENNILMSNIGDDKILKGSLKGSLASSYGSFLAANISCDLLGRSYKGRGFSCGFSEVEDLNGYCYVNLPNKIDTFIGDNGIRLSGGQNKRLALSRAFYHGKKIFVMDEATSSLDEITENKIAEEIKNIKGKTTMVIVSHSKNILKYCDYVYIIKDKSIKLL